MRPRRTPRRSLVRSRQQPPAPTKPVANRYSAHRMLMLQQVRNLVEAPMPCGLRPVFSPN